MREIDDVAMTTVAPHEVERRLQEYQALLANDSVGILVVCDGDIASAIRARLVCSDGMLAQLLGRSAADVFRIGRRVSVVCLPHR